MITVHTGFDSDTREPALQITLQSLTTLKELQTLLARALNTNAEFNKDWFALCTKLEGFIEKHQP